MLHIICTKKAPRVGAFLCDRIWQDTSSLEGNDAENLLVRDAFKRNPISHNRTHGRHLSMASLYTDDDWNHWVDHTKLV